MSEHRVDVLKVKEIEPHPNADNLQVTRVYGWQCCIRKGELQVGDLVVYIEPDFMVDTTRPEFAFLADGKKMQHRVKVKKLRGFVSQGLIIPCNPAWGLKEGDNAMETLGIIRYEPPEPSTTGGDNVGAPSGLSTPKYNVESFNGYTELFVPGEEVISTEKINGANARYVWSSKTEQIFCGSHTNWKAENDASIWWKALKRNPWIEEFCRRHPDILVYGEVFGNVQSMKYSAGPNQFFFAAFDILDRDRWLSYDECQEMIKDTSGFKWVPFVYRGPFDEVLLRKEAEGNSLWPKCETQIREGVVIRPVVERSVPEIGRVFLKMVSNRYLEKD